MCIIQILVLGRSVGSLPRSITLTVSDDCLVSVLQCRVHKSDCHAVVAFPRSCSLALDDCRRVAGRPIGVSLGTCRARGCALLMFCV